MAIGIIYQRINALIYLFMYSMYTHTFFASMGLVPYFGSAQLNLSLMVPELWTVFEAKRRVFADVVEKFPKQNKHIYIYIYICIYIYIYIDLNIYNMYV